MDTETGRYHDQLTKRREQVAASLRRIKEERNEAQENTDWLDHASHETRITLLDRLTEIYLTEIQNLDGALERLNENTYGICLACHNSIEPQRLDVFPQTTFCSACQETREGLQRA